MSWFTERLEKFRKQSPGVICVTVFARFVLGLGLGALLVGYLQEYDRQLFGWLLIILAVLLHIPIIYAWYKK